MIEKIHACLSAWGKWTVKQESREIGYPSTCPMFRNLISGRGEGHTTPPINSFTGYGAMEELSRIVSSLTIDMRKLCVEYYVASGKHRAIANRMRIHPDTLYQRLHRLHESVANRMCEDNRQCRV